jgi:hypothetical protein
VILPNIDIDFASAALYSMIDATISTLDVNTSPAEIRRITKQLTLIQWNAIYAIPPQESLHVGEILAEIS